jgi:tetratricopeptide (TPR) repeat protein
MKQDVIIPLKTESKVTVNTTNYWKTYPDDIEGLKCGDSISWDELEYFDTWGEYRLRKNQSISIHPTGGQILWITKWGIPIGEVNSMVNSITKKLGFKPEESRAGDNLPSYDWKKGLMEVSLMQEIDLNNNGAKKLSYIFTVRDDEAYALIKLKRNTNDPDRLMRLTKENVREILQRAFKKEKVDEAMRTIDSAITIDPSCYIAHFFKADIKFNSGNINGAKFDCIKAYKLNPYDQPTLELLLIVYLIENDQANATQLVQQKEILINKTARSAQILGDYYRMVEHDMNTACKYYNLAFDRGYPSALTAVQVFCNH